MNLEQVQMKDFFATQDPSQVDSPRSMNSTDNDISGEDYEVASDQIRAYLDRSVSALMTITSQIKRFFSPDSRDSVCIVQTAHDIDLAPSGQCKPADTRHSEQQLRQDQGPPAADPSQGVRQVLYVEKQEQHHSETAEARY